MRLDKVLSNLKYGSRTQIKKLCKSAIISVNGVIITNSDYNVNYGDVIKFDDITINVLENLTIMMNKPKGYVCANHDKTNKTVFELLGEPYWRYDLNVAGRLDIDTEGLIIMTTDGNLLHEIISPKKDLYKKYYVEFTGKLDKSALEEGVSILDGNGTPFITSKAFVEEIDSNKIYLSIKEGKFHQVKRMLEAINCRVTYLKRIEIGNYILDDKLKLGEYKIL